jgi:hypothetical protein
MAGNTTRDYDITFRRNEPEDSPEETRRIRASNPEQAADHLKRIMTTPPTWAVGLPLAAEVKIMERYGK